jgi:hypothetical protein
VEEGGAGGLHASARWRTHCVALGSANLAAWHVFAHVDECGALARLLWLPEVCDCFGCSRYVRRRNRLCGACGGGGEIESLKSAFTSGP